mgnify:CR=1 FL=1
MADRSKASICWTEDWRRCPWKSLWGQVSFCHIYLCKKKTKQNTCIIGYLQLFYVVGFPRFIFHRYKEQSVALKLVQMNGTPEEVAKRGSRFAREVTFLCRVQHKNLVKVRNNLIKKWFTYYNEEWYIYASSIPLYIGILLVIIFFSLCVYI